jgi:hypothetical protein
VNDTHIAQALRDYVAGDEPPLGLTSTSMLAEAHRRRRWRRGSAAMAGTATALLVVAALAMPAVLWSHDPSDGGASAGSAATCPVSDIAGDGRQTAMTCYVLATVAHMVPDARYEIVLEECRDVPPLHACPVGSGYAAYATITDAAGSGGFLIDAHPIDARDAQKLQPPEACDGVRRPPSIRCETRTGPGGIPVQILHTTSNGREQYFVAAFRTSTVVVARANNVLALEGPPTRPHPILTVDQLISLAIAPELDLFR